MNSQSHGWSRLCVSTVACLPCKLFQNQICCLFQLVTTQYYSPLRTLTGLAMMVCILKFVFLQRWHLGTDLGDLGDLGVIFFKFGLKF